MACAGPDNAESHAQANTTKTEEPENKQKPNVRFPAAPQPLRETLTPQALTRGVFPLPTTINIGSGDLRPPTFAFAKILPRK